MKKINIGTGRNAITVQAIGVGIFLGLLLLGALILSWLVLKESLSDANVGMLGKIVILAASAFGAIVVWKSLNKNMVIHILIYGCICFLILLFSCVLFYDGATKDVWLNLLLTLGGSAICCLVHLLPKGRKPYRKIRHS